MKNLYEDIAIGCIEDAREPRRHDSHGLPQASWNVAVEVLHTVGMSGPMRLATYQIVSSIITASMLPDSPPRA